jgi:hypothetical protein
MEKVIINVVYNEGRDGYTLKHNGGDEFIFEYNKQSEGLYEFIHGACKSSKEQTTDSGLNIPNVTQQRELLIAFGRKVASDILRSDKIMNVEDSYEEFKSNL